MKYLVPLLALTLSNAANAREATLLIARTVNYSPATERVEIFSNGRMHALWLDGDNVVTGMKELPALDAETIQQLLQVISQVSVHMPVRDTDNSRFLGNDDCETLNTEYWIYGARLPITGKLMSRSNSCAKFSDLVDNKVRWAFARLKKKLDEKIKAGLKSIGRN